MEACAREIGTCEVKKKWKKEENQQNVVIFVHTSFAKCTYDEYLSIPTHT